MKLFEIPVYALSREMLKKRYSNTREKLIDELALLQTQNGDEQKINQIIAIEAYPQRLWDYNHIVGYIVISIDTNDISFEQFVPADKIERYHWRKNTKTFLKNNQLNGYHFYYRTLRTDEEIRSKIQEMLEEIIKNMIDKRFYVDREAFDQANELIDYSKLLDR